MKRFTVTIELRDGSTTDPIRILAVDKINASRSARMAGIPWDDNAECLALMALNAARRVGMTSAEGLTSFLDEIADNEISGADESEPDPTSQSPAV